MKVLLCVLLAVVPAFAFPTPEAGVPPECIDPTFACQDLQSAKLCKVVSTCIHDVWETMSVPDSNDEICDICKEMVKEARDQLLSNMTQEEIKEVFEGSCNLIPVKLIAEGCVKIVDEIIPQLVEMLASRMDPTMVCTVSGMCFPSKKNMEIEKHILKLVRDQLLGQKDDQCAECTQMMTDVQKFMKDSSEAECKTYIEKLCHEKMPSYLCNIVLNTYFNDIYSFVLNTEPAKMCSSVGVCPQKCELKHQGVVSKVEDELTCEFCQHLLQHVKDLITANTTMEEFKTALLNFCKQTGKYADKCTNLVNDYYDMLFTYIKDLDTRGMCTLMGLCQNTGCADLIKVVPEREAHRRIPLIKLQPAQHIPRNQPLVRLVPAEMISKKQMRDSNDVFQLPLERMIHPLPVFERDTECALCKAFSFYLEKDLAGDNSKMGVRQAIDGVCEKWMVEYPDHCKYLVETYSQKMRMAIAKGVNFDGLCSEVKACPLEENKKELKVRIIPKVGESPFCDLCKEAMNEVEKILSDPSTKEKMENALNQACNVLPQSLKDDCVNFINQNVDALIDILEQELQPGQICPALRLCGSEKMIGVPPRVKDLECDVCKEVISSFRTKLQDPASKEMVMTFLEEGCLRLPTSIATGCKKFVDENIDYLMKIIVEEMDPQQVCSILKICTASVRVEQPKETVKDIECELCKEVVSKVEDMVKDKKTEEEIKGALEKVCTYLPSRFVAECNKLVDNYLDTLITLIITEADPDVICAALKVCPSSVRVEQPKETVKDIECDLCKEVVSKVEDMVKDKKTEDEIKVALEKVCAYLPARLAAKCASFVDNYIDTLITLIITEADPDVICAALKVCPSSAAIEQPKVTVKDAECDVCQQVVAKVEDLIKDRKTEDEIQKALDKVCSYLPYISEKCQNFVDKYTATIITLLMEELDPQLICAEIGACQSQIKEEKPKQKLKDVECDFCKKVVQKVEDMVKENKTEEAILKALTDVCFILPPTMTSKCEEFVKKNAEVLITFLLQDVSPDLVCAAAELCPMENVECEACQYALHFFQNELMDEGVKSRLKDYVKHLCTLFLPKSLSDTCAAYIDEYGDSLLVLIVQEIDPSTWCYEAKMCKNNATIPQLITNVAVPTLNHFQLDECSVCTTVVDYVDKLLEEDDVDKEITKLVEKVCVVIPASYRPQCSSILETYGPYILQMIGQMANSKQLCQEIDMCSRPAGHVHLIGGSKCTFGPSYWCHSPAHAAACKAESYCQTKVWSQ